MPPTLLRPILERKAKPAAMRPRRISRTLHATVDALEERQLLSAARAHLSLPLSARPAAALLLQQQALLRPALSNVVYRVDGTHAETLNVYKPAGTPPPGGWPVVMGVHGGGWHKLSKEQYAAEVVPALVSSGYEVVAMDYLESQSNAASWPTNYEDVRDAVRWVRANATSLDANPNRIAAAGESSGAHLAALLGTYPDGPLVNSAGVAINPLTDTRYPGISAHVSAVVDVSGPTDLPKMATQSFTGGLRTEEFLGGTPTPALSPSYISASPIVHVSKSTPSFFIVHGTSDTIVPFNQSTELATTLTAFGVPNQLFLVPNVGHKPAGFKLGRSDYTTQVLAFLGANL